MNKTIKFYKKEERWYAEVEDYIAEGGTEADCEMIAGANIWLEYLYQKSENTDSTITLEISTIFMAGDDVIHKMCEDSLGAVYYLQSNVDFLMWLCNVSHFIFGNHPETIYYKVL